MSKVFIVSSYGIDDGITIHGIYTTKEKAERAAVLFEDPCELDVDECELDEFPPCPEGLLPWHVTITKEGVVECVRRESAEDFHERHYLTGVSRVWGTPAFFHCCVYARDEAHAVEKTDARRLELIENGEW